MDAYLAKFFVGSLLFASEREFLTKDTPIAIS